MSWSTGTSSLRAAAGSAARQSGRARARPASLEDDLAGRAHHVGAVGELERAQRVLLDQQHGHAFLAQAGDDREDLVDHRRREAERRLVEQQQPRAGDESASDREHLLLAAREVAGP
ncbi:MAG TPA: hypothetical protein VHF90_09290 [Thermoleophilaceae bacterium]|nr:hypothetical protein [Thermoleophilaceae bacterium]